ncbi:GNAT family N-acetyltransferase [Agrobacterium rhizogenes]|uniref:GNAT family N-acetyltransferase n=1 Tax=Rhizobium rhizogenes TaxID=359 RepID=UPI001239328F|nr:GNAT family N-acetyltransferase [Rhizobium rhizogenes]KAA6488374.1 GNAT family N-acetyltransferase [Agrobacterium sp. ICMP 7243]NTF51978.1 GNAT family N-acetyltransferase [Rhizobium rhizogenes]NTG17522.1 GNAT family N-acetyltransferase [Rhizobium rhizogenes]NTG24182.1 GNAT family N-acetyltransferase [Rhizobium rhizogenes]NTG31126.1 GNAT family N-acetyltransferase [Rhizobium rhizogenes]
MTITIRPAQLSDSELILRFIRELAEYEKAAHEVEATTVSIEQSLFGPQSVTHAVICEIDGEPVGFAVWFYTYSTWLARNGLYLEDLYVTPQKRGSGAGKALLKYLAKLAVEKGCGRFEWSVLDWNEPAIRVYRSIGAEPQDEWIRYRLAGDALKAFADC